MTEKEVTFLSAGYRLSGTLALPAGSGPFACVVMITGSGPVDRNENHKRSPINVMGELAARLSENGLASLRYDKRGVGRSEGEFWATGFDDNVDDAAAALSFARAHEAMRPDQVFLLGHSEGAYIATRVAAGPFGAAGAVLLAGGARLAEEELRWQAEQVAATLTGINAWLVRLLGIDVAKSQRKQLEKIKQSEKAWYRTQLVAKVNAKWFREFLAYDPTDDLKSIRTPVLAISGSKDIQVDPGNLKRMAALVTSPLECHELPEVTHLLRNEPGPAGLSTYKKQLKRPMDPRVPELVIDWLGRHTAGE